MLRITSYHIETIKHASNQMCKTVYSLLFIDNSVNSGVCQATLKLQGWWLLFQHCFSLYSKDQMLVRKKPFDV